MLRSRRNHKGPRRRWLSDRSGPVAVYVALTAAATFGIIGLAIDASRAMVVRSEAQAAADAAALAVAQELAFPSGLDPAALAADYAAANGATFVACVCEPGTWDAVVEVELAVGDLHLVPGSPVVKGARPAPARRDRTPRPPFLRDGARRETCWSRGQNL